MNVLEIVHTTKVLTDLNLDINVVVMVLSYLTYDTDTFVVSIIQDGNVEDDDIQWCRLHKNNKPSEISFKKGSTTLKLGIMRMPLWMRNDIEKNTPTNMWVTDSDNS